MPDDTLSAYALSHPDKPGVIDDRPDGNVVTWAYAELEAQSNRVANLLLALGTGPGAKILWCGSNSPHVGQLATAFTCPGGSPPDGDVPATTPAEPGPTAASR